MATRQERLENEGALGAENPHAALLPVIEELKAKAATMGVHAGVVDHLDEIAFICKRDIKAKAKAVPTGRAV